MGPTWVLSAPDGPHIGPMNLAIRDGGLTTAVALASSGQPCYYIFAPQAWSDSIRDGQQ